LSSIIWTRAKEDWHRDLTIIEKLNTDGHKVVHIPCVSFTAVTVEGNVPPANYVIFHSSHAVRFAMAQEKIAGAVRGAVKIFSIGKGTNETLNEYKLSATPGFAGNSAKHLADQILQSGVGGSFLIPAAKEQAFDSAAYLRSHGRSAEVVVCYETKRLATKAEGHEFSAAEVKNVSKQLSGVICFASPSAVEGFNNVFQARSSGISEKLIPIAIGATTEAEVLKHFTTCIRSAQSTVPAVFTEALKQLDRKNGV
jgi:uroporphyrinogen-III synthase